MRDDGGLWRMTGDYGGQHVNKCEYGEYKTRGDGDNSNGQGMDGESRKGNKDDKSRPSP